MNDDFGIPRELTREVFTAQNQLRGAYRDSLRVGAWLAVCWRKPSRPAGTANSSIGSMSISRARPGTHNA